MAAMILIVIAGTIVLAGIIVVTASMFRENSKDKDGGMESKEIIVFDGVDVKKLEVGKQKGAMFIAGLEDFGTVIKGKGARHMWRVSFRFLSSERIEKVTFRSKMAIGRKRSDMNSLPALVITDDRLVSGIHCYLIGAQGTLNVQDADSLNHTYLNGHRVEGTKAISNGSVLRIGNTKIRITYEYR